MRVSRQDVRLAVRSFARQPRFTIVAVLSLALAMALNTTMYSVIDALVNPRLEIPNASRVYRLIIWGDRRHKVDNQTRADLLRSGLQAYDAVSYAGSSFPVRSAIEHGNAYTLTAVGVVAPNFFSLLGVRPASGRLFTDRDYAAGELPVILSDRLAATLFPDGEQAAGANVSIDGVRHAVIGVLSQASVLPTMSGDLWTLPAPGTLDKLGITTIRLRECATLSQAEAELKALSERFASLAGERPKDAWFQLKPAVEHQFDLKSFHYALVAAVIAVLLVACANLANLQLARGIGRARELAVRAAVGASRADLITQLFLESALLAFTGFVVGLLLTFWGMHALSSRIPPSVAEYVVAPQASWRVFAFAAVACVVCAVLVGLLPAIKVSRVDPNELLKSGNGTGANKRNRRQYGAMVIAQVALALSLLGATSLIVHETLRYHENDPGYDPKPLAHAFMLYRSSQDAVVPMYSFAGELVRRARSLPDVAEAGVSFYSGFADHEITVMDDDGSTRTLSAPTGYQRVSASFLRAKGYRIKSGRDFIEGAGALPEVIIDPPTARALWPYGDAVGRRIKLGSPESSRPWTRVVGVIAGPDARRVGNSSIDVLIAKKPHIGAVFASLALSDTLVVHGSGSAIDVLLRARFEPQRLPVTIRRQLATAPPFHLLWAASDEEQTGMLSARQSHDFIAAAFTSFSLVALGLAALGIYGIVAHSVAERKRELGVRIALGASVRDILHVVLREGNAVVLAGIAFGIFGVWKAEWWLRAFTFEEDVLDAPLFALMAVLMFAVALFAALIPALRATRIDPVESLRSE